MARRWIDEGASELERELLAAGREVPEPPADAQAQVWAALQGQLGPGEGPEGGGSPGGESVGGGDVGGSGAGADALGTGASTGAASLTELAKLTLVTAALGTGVATVAIKAPDWLEKSSAPAVSSADDGRPSQPPRVALRPRPNTPPIALESKRDGTPMPAVPTGSTARAQSPAVDAPDVVPSAVAAFDTVPPPPFTAPAPATETPRLTRSQLAEERKLLQRARSQLAAGQPTHALSTLAQAARRFPRGTMGQEREALTIRALWAAGQTAQARSRAQAFVSRHPHSPHAVTLQPMLR